MESKTSEPTFKKFFLFLCYFVAGFFFMLSTQEAGRKLLYETFFLTSVIVGIIALVFIVLSSFSWLFKRVVKLSTSWRKVTYKREKQKSRI